MLDVLRVHEEVLRRGAELLACALHEMGWVHQHAEPLVCCPLPLLADRRLRLEQASEPVAE